MTSHIKGKDDLSIEKSISFCIESIASKEIYVCLLLENLKFYSIFAQVEFQLKK